MNNNSQRKYPNNPRQNANLISILTFWWTQQIFRTGYKKDLEETDIYTTLTQDKTSHLGPIIDKAWEKEVESCAKKGNSSNCKPQLLRVLLHCFGKPYLLGGLGKAIVELFSRVYQPLLLATLLRYFTSDKEKRSNEVYYNAVGLILLSILDTIILHHSFHCILHTGLKIKIACTALLYKKILKLPLSVLDNETSVGQMVNFLSSDITKLEASLWDLHYIWISPIQLILITYIIFSEIGWAALMGLSVFLLFIPLQVLFAKKMTPLTLKSAERSDARLRLMNQIISGIQVIKMYVWEIPFYNLVEQARKREMSVIKKYSILKQLSLTLDSFAPRLCLFITILAYILFGNYINPEKVYLVTAYYNVLRNSMIFGFSFGLHDVAQALVRIRRLQKFMMHSEIIKKKEENPCEINESFALSIINVNAKWHNNKGFTLHNVNLTVLPGSFVTVVGQVGSGKSSLLQAILQELPLISGSIESHGRINYISQQPWIFASTVKQNILFGQTMDKSRYDEVINVCQMESDIDSFPRGDSTIVGERGINLSGGQRARINLARAIYKDADIYLLDDPLSAVDSHVSKRLVEDCICSYLKGKTRILVTHQLQYLQLADQIIVMNNGSIEQKGTFDQLQALGLDFMKLLKASDTECKEDKIEQPDKQCQNSIKNKTKIDGEASNVSLDEARETTMKGRLSLKLIFTYFKASKKPFMIALMMLIFILNQVVAKGSDYFVAFWVNVESNSWYEINNSTEFLWSGPLSRDNMMYLYSIMIVIIILLWLFQTRVYFNVCMWSSVNLHSAMFRSIMRATMYFYNMNPAGRILNRFARDINIVDLMLSMCTFDIIMIGLSTITVIIMIVAITPWLAIPSLLCICVFTFLRMIYICTCRSIKRLDGTSQLSEHELDGNEETRSPIFDHLSASLQGLTTIRANNAENILMADLCSHQDLHSSICFLFLAISRTFGFYIDMICQIYIGVIIIAFTVFEDLAVVGNIGLTITQIMSLTSMLQWGIRQTAEMESQLTSIERIREYIQLEEEPMIDSKLTETKLPDNWPMKGNVEFKNLNLKYSHQGDYILRDISFTVLAKEKIGIVGRTGAGKSSLINALFRLARVEGDIRIDDISISPIALHDFRSKISIIPQEPFLFSDSLRRNLDPFDQYSDATLWQALQDVELKDLISEMAGGLNMKISEGGSNFSVGQRQLLCFARAIIKNNKIMVLDEATANIDPYTDSLIQQTVKTKFIDCTVFTIAHRLNTIMDSDRIFVIDAGRLVECDHPYILLQQKGYFYNMVQQTGSAMAENLIDIATKSFYDKDTVPSR